MSENDAQNNFLDPDFQRKVFESLMGIFILPHIQQLQDTGELPSPLRLRAAQVLLYPSRRPQIRINDEVKAIAEMKLKPNVHVDIGDPIREDQLEALTNFTLTDDDDPDCGHIIFIQINGNWFGQFNFIYNLGSSRKHIAASKQFYSAATVALGQKHWPVFIDTLFSASELAIKALLMGYVPKLKKSTSHDDIKRELYQFVEFGNIDSSYKELFERLRKLRPVARYLHKDIELSELEAHELLQSVNELINTIDKSLST